MVLALLAENRPNCCSLLLSKLRLGLSPALSARVTLITINAVVDVPRHVVVLELVRIIAAMATSALENRVVVGIYVACRAHVVGTTVGGGEMCVLRVIECGIHPPSRVVTVLTTGWEKLGLGSVPGIRGVVVIALVAADANCRQRRVVVINVAIRASAGRNSMRSGQRKCCVVVLESRVGPNRRIVT